MAFRFVLPAFANAPLESSVLYLSGFWVGVLNNLTFDKLPLSCLTASDITKWKGAITTLDVTLTTIVVLVNNRVRVICKTGWLPHYLGWYILGGFVTLVLALLPGLLLQLHHYIIPMLVLPGTRFPTRLSAIYQGGDRPNCRRSVTRCGVGNCLTGVCYQLQQFRFKHSFHQSDNFLGHT